MSKRKKNLPVAQETLMTSLGPFLCLTHTLVTVPPCPPCEQLLAAVVLGAEVVVVLASSQFWGCPIIVIVSSTG